MTRSTVYRVLVRNQPDRAEVDGAAGGRITAAGNGPVPMQLWQLDVTASAFLAGGTEVKIVTGIDDHSRYCVIARAVHAGHRPAGLPGVRGGDGASTGCPRRC